MKNIFHKILFAYSKGCSSYVAQVICKNKKTLDIGCGFGSFLQYDPTNFTGIEINESAIEYCKKKGFSVLNASTEKIPVADASFERVVALQVIEHLTPDTAYAMIREAIRILKPEGELILSTEFPTNTFWNTFSHVKPYPPKSILKMLTKDELGLETFSKFKTLEAKEIYYSGKFHKNKIISLLSQIAANYLDIGRKNYTIILKKHVVTPEKI